MPTNAVELTVSPENPVDVIISEQQKLGRD
jgi:hypothetical protein